MNPFKKEPRCECCGAVRSECREHYGKLIRVDKETMLCIRCEETLNNILNDFVLDVEGFEVLVDDCMEKFFLPS
jgi:hypothetical protein